MKTTMTALMTRGRKGCFRRYWNTSRTSRRGDRTEATTRSRPRASWSWPPGNVARAEEHFRGLGIRVVTGHRYLGGYILDREAEESWLKEKIKGWTESVAILAGVSQNHPQSAYAGLQKSLQQEWAFGQRVTPGVGDSFGTVEKALRETFVLALFE